MKIKIATVFIILCTVYGGGYLSSEYHKGETSHYDWSQAPTINEAEPYSVWLPTPKEFQGILLVEQDGIFGPKTMKAWYEYLSNYNGVKACLKAGMR